MSIYKGSNKICDLYYHGVPVAEIYKGNILVFTKAAAEYLVTITQAANGTISAAPMQGPAGTLVTLSNSPNTGYQLTYYTVNGNQIQGNTFTLASDSTISGQFTAITYTVTIGSHTNGSLTANPMSGTYNTTVTLTGTPNTHYELDYYSVNGNRITGNTFSLTQNSTVAATFKQKTYTVTIGTHTNGTLSASPSSGVYGTTVTLSGTPNSGYALDYYTVGGSRITGNTFTLTGNTTVTAVYKSVGVPMIMLSYLDDAYNISKNLFTRTYAVDSQLYPYCYTYWSTYESTNRSKIVSVTSSIASGGLPSGYVGKKCWNLSNGTMASGEQVGLLRYNGSSTSNGPIPLTYKDWTVGMWVKPTAYTTNTSSPQNKAYTICGVTGGASSTKKFVIQPSSSYGGPLSSLTSWTLTTYNNYTTSGSGTSICAWSASNALQLNTWYYIAVYFNENDHSVEWYINGTRCLRATCSTATYWNDTSSSSVRRMKHIGTASTQSYGMPRYQCEYAIYQGKHVDKPTAPITPA